MKHPTTNNPATPETSAASPQPYIVRRLHRAMALNILLLGMLFGVGFGEVFRVTGVKATTKSIGILKTPAAQITLAQNAVVAIPSTGTTGSYCNVTVWNNSLTPVFWGGPQVGTPPATVANITVNATGGLPICTDVAVCPAPFVSINVMTGGMALIQTAVASLNVRYTVGEGCQP